MIMNAIMARIKAAILTPTPTLMPIDWALESLLGLDVVEAAELAGAVVAGVFLTLEEEAMVDVVLVGNTADRRRLGKSSGNNSSHLATRSTSSDPGLPSWCHCRIRIYWQSWTNP